MSGYASGLFHRPVRRAPAPAIAHADAQICHPATLRKILRVAENVLRAQPPVLGDRAEAQVHVRRGFVHMHNRGKDILPAHPLLHEVGHGLEQLLLFPGW